MLFCFVFLDSFGFLLVSVVLISVYIFPGGEGGIVVVGV